MMKPLGFRQITRMQTSQRLDCLKYPALLNEPVNFVLGTHRILPCIGLLDIRSRLQMDHAETERRGVRGAVGPLCNNPPNEVSGGKGPALLGSATSAGRRHSRRGSRRKNAPTIVPSRASVPEPRVQVGASPSRHGLSGRWLPMVMKGQGVAAVLEHSRGMGVLVRRGEDRHRQPVCASAALPTHK
jgi:hypothetical protein